MKKDYNKISNEEMMIMRLAKELRKQLKFIIEWGDIEDMKDALVYLANMNEKEAKSAIKSVNIAMNKNREEA